MLEAFNNLLAHKLDYLLGWMLYLPRDVMLIALAVLTSMILTFVRIFSTNQEWLRRADADQKRLKQLTAEAKRDYSRQLATATDAPARKLAKQNFAETKARYKGTSTLIKMKASKYEIMPLLLSLIPVALLATWAFARVAFVPPQVGQTIELRMTTPSSAVGRLAYISPAEGVKDDDGWIQTIGVDVPAAPVGWWDKSAVQIRRAGRESYNFATRLLGRISIRLAPMNEPVPPPRGVAVWHLKPQSAGEHHLKIHYDGKTFDKPLLVDGRHYEDVSTKFEAGPVESIDLKLAEQRLFGMVGAVDWLWLPPWLVAYLLVAIPFVSVLKRVFKIY